MSTSISEIPAVTPSSAGAEQKPAAVERMRLEFVDGLRALAALYVVVSHAWLTIPGRRDGHGSGWLNWAHLAVDLFLVVSGFCLGLPLAQPKSFGTLRGEFWDYYRRRARRILPPYYFALAASLVLIAALIGHRTGTHWDIALPVTWQAVVSHVLLVEDVFYPYRINHAMWSIAIEWQIYFLLPLIAIGWRRVGPVASTIIAVFLTYAATAAVIAFFPHEQSAGLVGYVALFALGTLAAFVSITPNSAWAAVRKPVPMTVLVLFLLVCVRLNMVSASNATAWRLAGLDFTMGLFSAALLVLASCPGKNPLRDALSVRPLVFLGTFAYSIYLMHAPLLQTFWQCFIRPLHLAWQKEFLALIAVGIPAVVCVCYLFFLGCEKPWLARRRNESARELAWDAAISPAP